MLKQLLQQLTDELELDPASTQDKEGMYLLQLSPEMQVRFKELEPGFFFHAPLGKLQEPRREELLMFLMKANFLGQGTGGAVIALDENENFLTLSLVLPYD